MSDLITALLSYQPPIEIYILLGLLFVLIYTFYPRERLNLFYALFNLSIALLTIMRQLFPEGDSLDTIGFLQRFIGVNILLFVLYALDGVRPIYWWLIGLVLFVDYPLSLLIRNYDGMNSVFRSAFTVVCLIQAIKAIRKKGLGHYLIAVIALAVTSINIDSLFNLVGLRHEPILILIKMVPFAITICGVAYLAIRYGQANKHLEEQLSRVKVLSEENLIKEIEKKRILENQNEKLEMQVIERTAELNNSLQELRSMQSQLIQSEKMASLGELTAGIAHEIQNPLNFVNNFSEMNKELVRDLKSEIQKGNMEEVTSLANDIESNEDKINHHGKRADGIVKSMLQHSRTSTGQRELTDLNALCDEYLRLSYHGFRAKDKSFNAKFETIFDKTLPKINVVPQDIGRVVLNLINNAFYAVNEEKKRSDVGGFKNFQGQQYEPMIILSTKNLKDKIEISIRDNGSGIPDSIKEKIFQPFFTTKPTGQGTGLGLSLSYDIVKALQGSLIVHSEEGTGSEFIIQLLNQ